MLPGRGAQHPDQMISLMLRRNALMLSSSILMDPPTALAHLQPLFSPRRQDLAPHPSKVSTCQSRILSTGRRSTVSLISARTMQRERRKSVSVSRNAIHAYLFLGISRIAAADSL